jgi:hypothetical protein
MTEMTIDPLIILPSAPDKIANDAKKNNGDKDPLLT